MFNKFISTAKFVFALTASFTVAVSVFGAGTKNATAYFDSSYTCENAPSVPTLNYWPLMYSDNGTEPCHDYPLIDAALDDGYPVFSQSQSDWNDGLDLSIGDRGVAMIYIHNGASNQIDRSLTMAKNVKVSTRTESSVGSSHDIRVTVSGDNTNSVSKSFTVNTPENAKLEVIANSGFMFAADKTPILDQQNLNLGNSTYTLGDLDACFEYSIFLTFKFKVVRGSTNTDNDDDSGRARIVQSKTAYNNTKGADATKVNASREDYITYTLTAKNTGTGTENNYVVRDDLSKVLPLADIIDYGGGYLDGNEIVFPETDIRAGQQVSQSFKVRVKYSLSPQLSYQMRNTYGNTVVVYIPGQLTYKAPKTGVDSNSAFAFGGLVTAGFALFRKRQLVMKAIFS